MNDSLIKHKNSRYQSNPCKDFLKPPASSQACLNTRPSSLYSESSSRTKASIFSSTQKINPRKAKPSSKPEPENPLTTLIQEKVSNLKSKFGELHSLRAKLVDCNQEAVTPFTSRPRIKSNEMMKISKNKALLNGVIFRTEDQRQLFFENNEKDLEPKKIEFLYKPEFDKIIFDTDQSFNKEEFLTSSKNEVEELKIKLKLKEKELIESERNKKVLEKLVNEKDAANQDLQVKLKKLVEANKSLKVQLNRLEAYTGDMEGGKRDKSKTIKNLSYIILSKDQNKEEKNEKDLLPKYMETLADLYNSDKLAVDVLSKLKRNQTKEALLTLKDKEDTFFSRLEQTQASILELESSGNTKSNLGSKKFDKNQIITSEDLISFIKCQAGLIEESGFSDNMVSSFEQYLR